MIIKIPSTERFVFEKACTTSGFTYTFYTMESNDQMLQVEVMDGGHELSSKMAYMLGRIVQLEFEISTSKRITS